MPARTQYIRSSLNQKWGKAYKGFSTYLNLAGQEFRKSTAKGLAAAGAEFMANEDWDWPRGARFDTTHLGRSVRGSKAYSTGFRGGDAMHPWYSGNLHDSIAVGVMQGTRILAARYMKPGATSTQTYNDSVIDGVGEGFEALQHASHVFSAGSSGNTLRAVLVIGVPYAEQVNASTTIGWSNKPNPHVGYADYLEGEFYTTILPKMQSISKMYLKLK